MFTCIVLSVLLVTVGIIYRVTNRILLEEHINNQYNILLQSSKNVDSLLKAINLATIYLCADQDIVDKLYQSDGDGVKQVFKIRSLQQQITTHINAPISELVSNFRTTLFLAHKIPTLDIKSNTLKELKGLSGGIYSAEKSKNQAWYQETLARSGNFHCFYLDDPNWLYISRLIKNPFLDPFIPNQELGVMVIALSADQLGKQIELSRMTKNTEILILHDEEVIYSNVEEEKRQYSNDLLTLKLDYQNRQKPVKIDGKKYFIQKTAISYEWSVLSLVPYDDILSKTDHIRDLIMKTTLILLVVAIISIFIMSKYLSQPIIKLSGIMESITDESTLRVSINNRYTDEIGVLYTSFNKMMSRIRELLQTIYKGEKQQRELELKTLQAQINPHFVYNTLDVINWKAMLNGQDEITEMVSSLATIFRYSIKDSDQEVSIGTEIEHVRNYIKIQSIRYECPLDIQIQIKEVDMVCYVPKFIFQPLVENALVHGLGDEAADGQIKIRVIHEKDLLMIQVEDNGKGCDDALLNNYLRGESNELLTTSDGFGIMNIHQRIQLRYGEDYGLVYTSLPRGTLATVTMPYEAMEDRHA